MTKRGPSGEDKLIERFFKPLASHPGALSLSDDAAFLAPPPGSDLVLTADMIVAGVHFLPDDPPETIGKKALRVNLSDLAAKGAEPVGALMTISLPGGTGEFWIEQFARGFGEDCTAFGCPLLGGDITKTPGPLSISINAIGKVPTGAMVRRAGAKPGDLVVVSGTIGDGALGLLVSRNDPALAVLSVEQREELRQRYRVPQPRMALAQLLRDYANAAMDISDGLAGDLAKLARVSGVGAKISCTLLPLSNAAHDALEIAPGYLGDVLSGGDDYEVIAAVAEDRFAQFAEEAGKLGVPVTAIGRFNDDGDVEVLDAEGLPVELPRRSFSHF